MTELHGKVAVVTGGASGIGRGIAEALLEQGATVVIADIQQDALDAAVAELAGRAGERISGHSLDVSKAASYEALRERVLETEGRIDVVCLNAGVGPSGAIRDLTAKDWEWILGVNLWGVIHGVTTFLPVLEANPDGGHIEITGSNAGFIAQQSIGSYSVAKYGVLALAEVLDLELREAGSKVRVTYLAPGMIRTNIGSSSRNRPAGLEGALHDADISKVINQDVRWMEPATAGRIAVRAILADDLYAPTDPSLVGPIRERHARIVAAHEKYPLWKE
ncbi:MAG: SDR family NAD(P)-dependent oxidoreductase [Microbacteriaceae bacterium]|nr:SDR family NAD(P)-dependent oxidoreductase [Microbacteriaceae bacterium]